MTVTMTYDYENRMTSNNYNGSILSYTYSGDGLKRAELRSGVWTTLVWDGDEYLGEV